MNQKELVWAFIEAIHLSRENAHNKEKLVATIMMFWQVGLLVEKYNEHHESSQLEWKHKQETLIFNKLGGCVTLKTRPIIKPFN